MTDYLEKAKRLHSAGQYIEAQGLYKQVIEQNSHDAEALYLLGTLLGQRGRFDDALALLRRAVLEDPKNSVYHCNLGVVEQKLSYFEAAKGSLLLAIKLDNNNVDALYNLGKLYKDLGLVESALVYYRDVLSLSPSHSDALINLGNILVDMGRLDEAIEHFQKAVDAGEHPARAHINLGNTYRRMGFSQRAIWQYGKAIKLNKHDGLLIKRAVTVPVIYQSLDHIYKTRESLSKNVKQLLKEKLSVEDPALETSTTNFFLAYQNQNNRDLQRVIAKVHLKSCQRLGWSAPHCRTLKKTQGKIKIGFISGYFRQHSVGRLMVGLISQIPKDLFEVVIITNRGQRDPISKIIESMADKILYLSDKIFQTQEDIGESQLDVLFYADIGMDIRTYFLAFARLARTQCVFWGHPDTTGIPNIDYFLSSSLIEPRDGDQHYTETLRQFASLPTYYARPDLPSRLKSRDEFGLSEDQNLYLCPQSAIKFHPDIDNIFLQILESDQNSRLLVLEGAVKNWTSLIQNRWKRTIGRIGERIDVIPRLQQDDFLALQAISDVILDTPHFSGGNTSYEAFSLSKPVVTLDGSFMRGRVTAGMYRCIGVNNCTAASSSDYAEIAVKLGTNQDYRKLIEERIKESSDELFKVDLILEEFIQFIESAIE